MTDPYGGVFNALSDPATRAAAIVPSDTADFADTPKSIYVGTGGDVRMIGMADPPNAAATLWKNVADGALIPFRARRILATGTTATSMLALY